MISVVEHFFTCLLVICVFFGKMSMQVLCRVLFRLFGFFILNCVGFLHILLLLCCLVTKYIFVHFVAALLFVTKMCLTLCDLMECGLPGSSPHGFSQARILDWVAFSFSIEFFNPGNKPASPGGRQSLYHRATRKAIIHILTLYWVNHLQIASTTQ